MSDEPAEVQQQAFGESVFSNLFETFVEPDLVARMERGELPNPFPASSLRAIQIVFYPEGRPPTIRINSEVRAVAQVKPKAGLAIQAGDPVTFDMIESIGEIALGEDEADCGHATFLRSPDGWVGYFSFVYYKGTAQRHLTIAEQFLQAAQGCRDAHHWVAFADNLFSATELAAKASLLCLGEEVAASKKHHTIHSQFNKQRHIGNVDDAHARALNRLWDFRQKGRYVEDEISFTDEDADQLLSDVRSLMKDAARRASSFSR